MVQDNSIEKIRCRKSGLIIHIQQCQTCANQKWCIIQQKTALTLDKKYANDATHIKHFGCWLTVKPALRISRDNYAIIDKRNSFWRSTNTSVWYKRYYASISNNQYEDHTCRTYTDDWCERHRNKCLINFDLNMSFFQKIPTERFENVIAHLLTSAPFEKVENLQLCNCSGIYIMILDQYKQIYIGQAHNIKERIKRHWNDQKRFDCLLWGTVANSILSIDSFGALDTTRIYILPMETSNLEEAEKGLVSSVNPVYLLNRIGGGNLAFTEIIDSSNTRNFEQFPSDIIDTVPLPKQKKKTPILEKQLKSVEYLHIIKNDIDVIDSELSLGSIICVQLKNKTYIGKIKNITKCYIDLYMYGEGTEIIIETQKIQKLENKTYNNSIRFSKSSINKMSWVQQSVFYKNKTFKKTIGHKRKDLWE